MRVICRSSTVDHKIPVGAVAELVIDEAHLFNVMVNMILIDLLSFDPRFGRPIHDYLNISIYLAIGLGEEHVLTWSRKRVFRIVFPHEKINRLLFKLDDKKVVENGDTDVVAQTTYSAKMKDSEREADKELLEKLA